MSNASKSTRNVLILILITFIYRAIIAANTGLGIGESYYFRGADNIALSYFDQPPLFFWLSHISLKLFGFSPLSIRLPTLLLFSGTTWVLYLIGKYLFSARSAFYAMLVFNLSALFVIDGIWFQPDAPLLFFWSICLYCLIQLFFPKAALSKAQEYLWWIILGISMGLTTLSKYHVVFLVLGMFTFILTQQRHWFKHPGLYLSLVINCVFALPILMWNLEHNFASFVFQGSRVLPDAHIQLHFDWFLRSFVGQALWLMPWIWVPIVYQLVNTYKLRKTDLKQWFCFCMAVYPIVFFTILTLWADLSYHFHWQAAGYMILFLPLGLAIEKSLANGVWVTRIKCWIIGSAIFTYGVLAFLAFHMETGFWQTYGPKWITVKTSHNVNAVDPTMDGYDYTDLYTYFQQHDLFDQPNLFVGASSWLLAGKVDWALKGRIAVRSFEEQRNYAYYFADAKHLGQNLIYVTRDDATKAIFDIQNNCSNITKLDTVPIKRHGITEMYLNLYTCQNFHE